MSDTPRTLADWVLVPKEATDEMCTAAYGGELNVAGMKFFKSQYRNFLDAAPHATLLAEKPDAAKFTFMLEFADAVLDPKVEIPVSHPSLIRDMRNALLSQQAQLQAKDAELAAEQERHADLDGQLGNLEMLIEQLKSELAAAQKDAERYRWLRDNKALSISVGRDEDHTANYCTAKKWIEEFARDDFNGCGPSEIETMKATNTIWTVQIYPNTPVGFNVVRRATLDAALDAAREEGE